MKIVVDRAVRRNFNVNESHAMSLKTPGISLFWMLGFIYACMMALLLQKVVLPLMPELHAGHGLLRNDAILFHNIAVEVAKSISANGWSEWSIFPRGQTGNVGLLAAIYALLGPDPVWFIPFNAAAHATGAALICRLGHRLWSGRPGQLGGLIAGIAFLVFPSSLQWYGQNHKDAFAILGSLLVLDAWFGSFKITELSFLRLLRLAASSAAGALLLGLVRPYFVLVLLVGFLAAQIIDFALGAVSRYRFSLVTNVAKLIPIGIVALVAFASSHGDRVLGGLGDEYSGYATEIAWQWNGSSFAPAILENTLRRASALRAHFVAFGRKVSASSEIDGERLPDDALSALAYLPRALIVGLLVPFPDTWGDRVTAPRLVGAMETAVWYLFALGIVVTIWRRPSRELLAGLVFCCTLLTILAYIHPNVGTLYRQRYGFWQFVLLCGSIGWFGLIEGYLQRRRRSDRPDPVPVDRSGVIPPNQFGGEGRASVDRLASAGFLVVLITLACYLGFFVRDLLMIQKLGMGGELDAFYTAAMIPMFFVACLAMPMADALTPAFLATQQGVGSTSAETLLRHKFGFAVLVLGGVVVLVEISAPWLAAAVLGDSDSQLLASSTLILRWFAPILLLSAGTIVGNAALNARGRQRDAALGQLIVPAMTIGLLILMPASEAVVAAVAGMLGGTFANVMWVALRLRSLSIEFIPALPAQSVLGPVVRQYRRLILAALLPAILVPLNYAFAAQVVTGAISAWAFASKIVVLFTGMASVAATSVVLPHLSTLLTEERGHDMRHDSNLLLTLGVWLGGLIAVGGFVFADPLIAVVISRDIEGDRLVELANIVKIGVVQLPVVISWALVAKMAIVSGNSRRVMFAAFLGFGANLLVNLWLVPQLGVMGVAVGSTAASFASTATLLLVTFQKAGLKFRDVLTVFGGWGVWAGVCFALASQNTVVLVILCIALVGLGVTQMVLLNLWREGLPRERGAL